MLPSWPDKTTIMTPMLSMVTTPVPRSASSPQTSPHPRVLTSTINQARKMTPPAAQPGKRKNHDDQGVPAPQRSTLHAHSIGVMIMRNRREQSREHDAVACISTMTRESSPLTPMLAGCGEVPHSGLAALRHHMLAGCRVGDAMRDINTRPIITSGQSQGSHDRNPNH